MMGTSYLSYTQVAAAIAASPSLVTIVPFATTSDLHQNWVYKGSEVLDLNLAVLWTVYVAVNPGLRAVRRRDHLRGLVAYFRGEAGDEDVGRLG
jgi:predicted acyl esterase